MAAGKCAGGGECRIGSGSVGSAAGRHTGGLGGPDRWRGGKWGGQGGQDRRQEGAPGQGGQVQRLGGTRECREGRIGGREGRIGGWEASGGAGTAG